MRPNVLWYDLSKHPDKDSINLLRSEYYSNQKEIDILKENLEKLSKEEKEQTVHYILALSEALKLQESEIRKKIQSHLPTLYQPFFGTKVKISNV